MKVLIAGGVIHQYLFSIENAFFELGNETMLFRTLHPKNKHNFRSRVLRRFLTKRSLIKLYESDLNQQRFEFLKVVEGFQPDRILIIKGNVIDRQSLMRIKEKFPSTDIGLWVLDPVSSLPEIKSTSDLYEAIFVYDKNDIPEISKWNPNAFHLPMAFDPKLYKPMKGLDKRWKISFIGSLYPNRIQILEKAIRNLNLSKDEVIFVDGIDLRIWPNLHKFRVRNEFLYSNGYVNSVSLLPEEVCKIYNESLINLNIHRLDTVSGYNPRTFEIPGSGGTQIVDKIEGLSQLFCEKEEEVIFFSSTEEMIDRMDYFIRNPILLEKIRENGFQRALNEHTFKHRAQSLIKTMDYSRR